MKTDVDYRAVFEALPGPSALLAPDLVIVGVNRDFLAVTGRQREDVIGRRILEAFPANPVVRSPEGQRTLRASLEAVLASGMSVAMPVTRYDVEVRDHSGLFEERYWIAINAPVLSHDGDVILIIHRFEEVTDVIGQVLKAQRGSGPRGIS
jgi:PAS domain S-box-containing protein